MDIAIKIISFIIGIALAIMFFICEQADLFFKSIGVLASAYTVTIAFWALLQNIYEWYISKRKKEKTNGKKEKSRKRL